MLRGLDQLIARETGMPVHIAHDPLSCVVMGTGMCVDGMQNNPALRSVLLTDVRLRGYTSLGRSAA